MIARAEDSLGWRGWGAGAAIALVLLALLLIGTGCGSTPAEVKDLAEGQVGRWRLVRREGKTWSDAEWDATLRAFAAAERGVAEWLTRGEIPAESTERYLREERSAP